jgi:hypothetical protein
MKYQPPFGSSDPNESYADRNLASGVQGSRVSAKAIEGPQRELAHLISYGGLTPDETDNEQARKAIEAIFLITAPVTKTVYGAGADFADLNTAYAWLSRRRITSTGSVVFQLAAGQFTVPGGALIGFSHPDGLRVTIRGANLLAAFPTMASFAANGPASGTRASDQATNLALLRTKFATELRLTGGSRLDFIGQIGGVDNLLISGDGTVVDGLTLRFGYGALTNVAVVGFGGKNVSLASGGFALANVVGIGGTTGISALGGAHVTVTGPIGGFNASGDGVVAVQASSFNSDGSGNVNGSGNAQFGVCARDGSVINVGGAASFARQNGPTFAGYAALYGSKMGAAGATATNNNNAFFCAYNSMLDAFSTTGSSNTTGYSANYGGLIHAASGSAGTLTPAANTVGNNNSYISA